MPTSSKKSIYDEVTNMIIEEIETHQALPWTKDWSSQAGALPFNSATGRYYNGINILVLWIMTGKLGYNSCEWMTYRQAQSKSMQVQKGEKGTQIIFYKTRTKINSDTDKEEKIPVIRTYSVFNRNQLSDDETQPATIDQLPDIEKFIQNLGADVRPGDPCYLNSRDIVRIPSADQFQTTDSYYATILHELTHWTGHKSRLNRDLRSRFGDESYAAEELIAELGSAFLCAELGIPGVVRHAGYIQNWLKLLKADNKAIFTAAAAASKACEYLHSLQPANKE